MPVKKGGKKGKKAKKPTTSEFARKLELKDPEDSLQEYAQITKVYGGARFEAKCFDGKTRLAHSRGSLKKKKIYVKLGDVVVVSLRDFQDDKSDIIYVYTQKEVKDLKKLNEIPFDVCVEDSNIKEDVDIGVEFEEEDVVAEQPNRDLIVNFDLI